MDALEAVFGVLDDGLLSEEDDKLLEAAKSIFNINEKNCAKM